VAPTASSPMRRPFWLRLLYWRIFHPKTYAAWKLIMSISPETVIGMIGWDKAPDALWEIDRLPRPGCECVLCRKLRNDAL
jgi:hypothetical protein